MAFRDENDALRAKVRALEGEVGELKAELAGEDAVDIGALVRERDQPPPRAGEPSGRRWDRFLPLGEMVAVPLDERPLRVTRFEAPDRARIVIAAEQTRDALRRSMSRPLLLGLLAFMVLGHAGAGWSGAIGLPFVLLLSALLYGYWARQKVAIDVTHDGYCAVFTNDNETPRVLAKSEMMAVDVDDPVRGRLGRLSFYDGIQSLSVPGLTAADIEALRRVLPTTPSGMLDAESLALKVSAAQLRVEGAKDAKDASEVGEDIVVEEPTEEPSMGARGADDS